VSLVFFLDLFYSDIVDDIVYDSIFHICDFIPALGCICIYVCYPACYWQPKVFMEEFSLFVSICWPSSRTRIPFLGSGAWQNRVDWTDPLQQQLSHLSQVFGVGYVNQKRIASDRAHRSDFSAHSYERYAFIKTFSLYILSHYLYPFFHRSPLCSFNLP